MAEIELKKKLAREKFMYIAGKDRVIQHKEWKNHFKTVHISPRKAEALWKRLDKNGSGLVTYVEFDDYIIESIAGGMKLDFWLIKDMMAEFEEDNKKQQNDVEVRGNTIDDAMGKSINVVEHIETRQIDIEVRDNSTNDDDQKVIAYSEPMQESEVVEHVVNIEKVVSKKEIVSDRSATPTYRSTSSLKGLSPRRSTHRRITAETEHKKQLCREVFMGIAGEDHVIKHKQWTEHWGKSAIPRKTSEGLWNKIDTNKSLLLTYPEFHTYMSDSIERGKKEDEWVWDGTALKKQEPQDIMIENAEKDEEIDQVEPVIERREKKEEVVEPIVKEENDKEPNENEFLQFEAQSADRNDEALVEYVNDEKQNTKIITLETVEVAEEPEIIESPSVLKVLVISEPPLEEEPIISEPEVEEESPAVKPMEIEEPPVKKDPVIPDSILLCSYWALNLGFALWVMWGFVAVRLQISGFDLGDSTQTAAEYKTSIWGIPTIAGLSGATMRIVNGFMVKVGGGRNVTAVTAALLLIPAVGLGITATSRHTGFAAFCTLAALSGIGGGFYISSMFYIGGWCTNSNIFRVQSKHDFIGSLGVALSLLLIAIVVCFPFGGGFEITHNDIVKSGKKSFLYMAGWIWVPLLLICLAGAIKYLRQPEDKNANLSLAMLMLLVFYGLLGCVFAIVGGILLDYIWLFWILSIAPPLLFLRFFPPADIRDDVQIALEVFKLKYTWIMGVMSLLTFGSFIGFAFSSPKLIIDVFGYLPDGSINPNVPRVSVWAWLGPLAGILIRPAAFWLCEEMNSGSAVVLCSTLLQILFSIPLGLSMSLAENSDSPDDYFPAFICFFILEFIACGMGIVGVAKQIVLMSDVFKKEYHEYVSWATSCIGCYGAFLVPAFFGVSVANRNGSYVIYSMIGFYCICLVIQIKYFGLEKY